MIKGEKDKMVRAKDVSAKAPSEPVAVFFFPDYGVSVKAASYEEALAIVTARAASESAEKEA